MNVNADTLESEDYLLVLKHTVHPQELTTKGLLNSLLQSYLEAAYSLIFNSIKSRT